jgi:hypothetical protein
MKSLKEIHEIINRMPMSLFNEILDAEYDSESLDYTVARPAYFRLLKALDKAGLTWEEWKAWDNE